MPDSVLRDIERRIAEGTLARDPGQAKVAEALDRLAQELQGYEPQQPDGWRRFLPGNGGRAPPRGLYIFGGVGRGKTMLMDRFHELAPIASKRRAHFHAFMGDLHGRIHAIRGEQRTGHVWEDADPIALVAGQVVRESALLCLDEFQVTDIADAMILGRLFEALLEAGAAIVTTSNTAPRALYRDGLNRDAFLPFITLIEERLDTIDIDAGRDYRRDRLLGERVYMTPLNDATAQAMDRLWRKLTDTERGLPVSLQVLGRTVTIPETSRGVARLGFEDLCGSALGAADYLAIAEAFHTILLEDVPRLARDRRNEALRFITLIDTLYEKGVRLVLSAEGPPETIYAAGGRKAAFARAVSRLHEMQSANYWESGARPSSLPLDGEGQGGGGGRFSGRGEARHPAPDPSPSRGGAQ